MRRRLIALLALAASLTASAALQPPAQQIEPYPDCPQGFPGAYVAYCMEAQPHIVLKSWTIPSEPPEALVEAYADHAAWGRLWRLQLVWRDLQTQTLEPMPEAPRVLWQPTEEAYRLVLRVPATPPGEGWAPDLVLAPGSWVWLPDVGNGGVWAEEESEGF